MGSSSSHHLLADNNCGECGALYKRRCGSGAKRSSCAKPELGGCGRNLCTACVNFGLVCEAEAKKGLNAKAANYCRKCFLKNTTLSFDRNHDIVEPQEGKTLVGELLFVHGGAGSRLMFIHIARAMANHGYRSILIDLPGHGARVDEPLTIDSACEAVANSVKQHQIGSRPPIYIGGSLGGYIGMEAIGRYPELFSGAVLAMCGQDVGVKRGCAAGCGLCCMSFVATKLSQATLLDGLIGETKKNKHVSPDLMMEIACRPGMFFQQAQAQIEVLKGSDPRHTLPLFRGPVLFANGSRDHNDSDKIWVSLCQGERVIYEGGDHFFSHDDRFKEKFIDDVLAFCNKTLH